MSIIDEIKARVNIVDIVEKSVKLSKSGRSYTGFCPFHSNTHTPAFVVWPETGTWHCFGQCNTGGDVFSFLMQMEGIAFGQALHDLARQAGVELNGNQDAEKKYEQERKRADAIKDLYQYAADFYSAQLWSDAAATEYLTVKRGLLPAQIKAIKWGYSKADTALLNSMLKHRPELVPLAREVGLVREDGKDFTANANGDTTAEAGWIVIAHHDHGRIVGLSARAVGDVTAGGKTRNMPKQVLPYLATHSPRNDEHEIIIPVDDDRLIITEGSIDAESCRRMGVAAYALGGPAPSADDDPRLIYVRKAQERGITIYIGMSNDAPGDGYARKLAGHLDPLTRIVYWPKKERQHKSDANSWMTDDGAMLDEMNALLDCSSSYLDISIDEARRKRDRERATALEAVAALVARLDDTARRMYVKTVCEKLKIGLKDFEKMVAERMPRSTNNGITISNGELCLWGMPLINGAVRIETQLTLENGLHTPSIAFCVSGIKATGEPLRTIDKMPAEEFETPRWMGRYWGADLYCHVGSGKYHMVKRGIIENSAKNIKRENVYVFTGWHTVGGQRAFLTSSGALNSRLDETARVDLDNNLGLYRLLEPPVGEALCEAVRAWLGLLDIAPETITVPLFCAMHAAPLTSIKPLNTIIDVYGQTQAGKSTITHLFLTAFGAGFVVGREYKAPQNWSSSFADIEGSMFTCKDVPLIIDDYTPQVEPDQIKKAAMVVRAMGNRAGKGRRYADMTAREKFPPRGMVIMTAEQPLNDEGIVGRVLYVNVPRDSMDKDKLTAAQEQHHLYSQAMAAYISYLAENWETVKTEFHSTIDQSLREVRGVFPNHERLCDYFAVLNSTSVLTLRWMAAAGAITQEEAESRIVLNKVALLDVLERQQQSLKRQSPVYKFFMALDELMTQGKCVFAPKNNPDYQQPYNTVMVGWHGENTQTNHAEFGLPDKGESWVWLLISPALREVKDYLSGLDEPFNTLKDALVRELQQQGYIARRDGRHVGVKLSHKYGEFADRVLVIDAAKVLADYGVNLAGFSQARIAELVGQQPDGDD